MSRAQQETDEREPFSVGDVLLDEYTVTRRLGFGGMGVVYLVECRSNARRYALKTTRRLSEKDRNAFLRELRTWIDLPKHPHLAACHFFRTIDDRTAIFAEYVDGGSLHDVIEQHRFPSLPEQLDIAIQFAWGLHAAHEAGVIHRDVKPSNLLISSDGVAKLCDFGVSSARSASDRSRTGRQGDLEKFSSSGGGWTIEYGSPEQASRKPLTRATDQWSWGLSVLEMLQGERTWAAGVAAPVVLDECLKRGLFTKWPQSVSDRVVAVLRRCFREEPSQRWPTMRSVADELCTIYREVTKTAYSREVPSFIDLEHRSKQFAMPTESGTRYARYWLGEALQAEGKSSAEADSFLKSAFFSQTGQLADELAGLDEARRIFEQLVAAGRTELSPKLANVWIELGEVHQLVGDYGGALSCLDRAIEIFEELVKFEKDVMWRGELIDTYTNKARTLTLQGNLREAEELFNHAIQLILVRWARPDDEHDAFNLDYSLARLFFHKGCNSFDQGDLTAALGLFDRAILTLQNSTPEYWTAPVVLLFSEAGQNKAAVLGKMGRHAEAREWSNRATDLQRSLVSETGEDPNSLSTARSLAKRAHRLSDEGDFEGALDLMRQSIAIYEQLVIEQGQRVHAETLAREYMNLGVLLCQSGSNQEALEMHDRSVQLYEDLVHEDARFDFEHGLIHAMLNRVIPVRNMRRYGEALQQLDDVIARLQRLIDTRGKERPQLLLDLALAQSDRGFIQWEQGLGEKARDSLYEARDLLRRLVFDMHRSDLQHYLDGVDENIRAMS